MDITYIGHSCFLVKSEGSSVIFDPFMRDNPLCTTDPSEISVDAILVTHGHLDHVGDAVEISKKNNAVIVAPFELANYFQEKGANSHPMHIGGTHNFPFGTVKLTIAHHGSTTDLGATGNPCGFLLSVEGKTIYHAGDTGLFLDMKLIGELNDLDIALIPIGDNFTMGIPDAVKAVEFLHPSIAIPMHYNTFDLIQQNPETFTRKIKASGTKGVILEIGGRITI